MDKKRIMARAGIMIFFIYSFVTLFPVIVCADSAYSIPRVTSLKERTSLAGEWKILLQDDKIFARPGFNDSAWDTVVLPGSFMPYVLDKTGKGKGVLWLRKTVVIDRDLPHEELGLIMGRISLADETYFNGEKIGGMGEIAPETHSQWNHPRHYTVPRTLIRYGENNVISVRVSYFIFGEVLGTLSVTNIEDWTRSRSISNFFLITLGYIIIAMGIPLFFIFLFFYILRPQSQEYLFYCLQLLCGVFIVLDSCTYWNFYGKLLYRYEIMGDAWVALNVFHPIFLHRFYDLKRKKTEIMLWFYLAVVIAVTVFFNDEKSLRTNGLLLIIITTCIGFYNISCHISALIKKRPYAKIFSFFGITVILGAIHDGFLYLIKFLGCNANILGNTFQYLIFHYSASVLYLGTSIILVNRFIKMMNEVEDLNESMESFIIENALLNERLKESCENRKMHQYPVVSDRAEEKVQKVIRYINENYRYDISREGLAASIDIHPDNLGRMFKMITKKKLGDYINEMRIRESAKKLIETEETVINIAFSVGFDSLRTFNRAFFKNMKMTPEKYRKMKQAIQKTVP